MGSKRPSPSGPFKEHRRPPDRKRPLKPEKPGVKPEKKQGQDMVDAYQPPADWQTWPEMTIVVDQLPESTTTSNLWDWFSQEGEIGYLDIYETPGSPGSWSGKVRFEPPPRQAFWSSGTYRVPHPDVRRYPNGIKLIVAPARFTPIGWVQSPVCPDRKHPVKITLYPQAVQFGSMLGPKSMKVMQSFYNTVAEHNLKLELNLRYRFLAAFFPLEVVNSFGRNLVRQYKVVIDLSQMKVVHKATTEEGECALVIPVKFPPQYYWKKHNIRSTFSDEVKNWNAMEAWYRATDIVEDAGVPMKHPIAIHTDLEDPGFIDIGRWTTFRFILEGKTRDANAANNQLIGALDDFNIATEVHDDFQITRGTGADMWKQVDHPPLANEGNALEMLQQSSFIQLPFELRYQLEVCISRCILNEHTITTEFLEKLSSMSPQKARHYLEFLADEGKFVQDPMGVFQNPNADAFSSITRVPQYCALVRKAVITPTTVRFNTPTVEMSNRVMRQYKHIQDRFLRIQFVEELEQGRIAVNKDQNDEIYKRVLRTLYQGIRIGDRVYQFLAFGNSQLRVNGAYFFCPTEHTSCDDIRKWMGQFSHIRVVAKYAARLGQCFSTTREVRGLSSPTTREILDIERNGYCFTDGVGKISQFVAHLVNEDMALDIFDKPSAFQFRMGGCKGILTLWPEVKGMDVHVRESQKKFEADSRGLEIIRCAGFATATLNRQTITILEALGVPTRAFTFLLENQLESYELAMEKNEVAIEMLTKFVDEQQTSIAIADLIKAGFKTAETREPFVTNILNLWRSWSLKLLKEKARIQVEKSAFVLGCVDETQTLRGHSYSTEGSREKDINELPQIFLQITDSNYFNRTHIIQGVCIVGRNPSLHPGDIRVVEAVDCPKLRHIKNVVVFPATGDRPVPNMLSGGDLDGDDFFIIWEPTLMPKIWNYPPMSYDAPKPQELERDVNVDDLRNFFVKYLKNDKLPLIATSHLAMSDVFGPMHKKCLELAELHSKAVDYPKTGDPATLRRDQQPRRWPHFMEKKHIYHSRKALGVIFDKVVNKTIQFNPIWDSPFDQRITQKYQFDDTTLEEVRQIKSQYDTSVRRLLNQHSLKTEFELWTGFAMSKPAVGSDYKRQQDLNQEYDALRKRFREICYEVAGGKQAELIDRFVATMYKVTEDETNIALSEPCRGPTDDAGRILQPRELEPESMPLISFPWIFDWVMCRLALGASYDPEASLLAAARRRATHYRKSSSGPVPAEVEASKGEETSERRDIDPDIHLRLLESTDPVDPCARDEDCASLAAPIGVDDENEIEDEDEEHGFPRNCDERELLGEDGDTDREKAIDEEPSEESGTEEVQVTGVEAEEDNAIDRLAALMGEIGN